MVSASHRPGAEIHLDLEHPVGDLGEILPKGITHALLCSSLTNIDACYWDPEGSKRFNVTHTMQLIQGLLNLAIQPIFCSSDLVFKGDRGDYKEDDFREPTTVYGSQKKMVEDFLVGQASPFLIIRMSKLYSLERDDPSPVAQTLDELAAGNVVRVADDAVICPTCVYDIPPAVGRLMGSAATGAYHIAAPQRYSRYSLALAIAETMGREHLVQRCSISDFAFAEPRPVDNSLNVSKFLGKTGFVFSNFAENLHDILAKRVEVVTESIEHDD